MESESDIQFSKDKSKSVLKEALKKMISNVRSLLRAKVLEAAEFLNRAEFGAKRYQ
jgi:DNA-directed RNA polymerase subunit L